MKEMLKDGKVVEIINFPNNGFQGSWDKLNWGKSSLKGYVEYLHPYQKAELAVLYYHCTGRLTGIAFVVRDRRNVISYMLDEPKKNPNKCVFVMRMVEDISERKDLDKTPLKNSDTSKPLTHKPFQEALVGFKF